MINANIDENDVKTWVAWNETTQQTERVVVDPVLDALLIHVVPYTTGTFTAINRAKIDQNDAKTLLGYNETTGLVEAMRCGNSGELIVQSV